MVQLRCPGCLERDEHIVTLERRIAELEATVRDLTLRLGTNATNSGTPPSANPLDAPKPVIKTLTGNKTGGQPGHPPRLKRRLPPERLHQIIPFVSEHCDRCHKPLPTQPSPDDPEPSWHQVAELPPVAAQITEYQGHYRTCPDCGTLNHAAIPHHLKAHRIGPRLASTLGYLIGKLQRLLRSGCRCADSKAATFCANLLDIEVGLWQFVVQEGVEPTNNHAERLLRRGVLWRKNAFGSHNEKGCRFVERLLTVVQTRRLQGKSVLSYLHAALVAHRNGLPAPSLLSAR